MSILKSTNSGSARLLTLEYLFSRGWYHPKMNEFDVYKLNKFYGIPNAVNENLICYKDKPNNLSVIRLNGKVSFCMLKTERKEFKGDIYDVTYIIEPKTIHDISLIENYFDAVNVLEKIKLERILFEADCTRVTYSECVKPLAEYFTMNNFNTFDTAD